MSTAVVTGSGGLVGSCISLKLMNEGLDVVGIDCDFRSSMFGRDASVHDVIEQLKKRDRYRHSYGDIRHVPVLRSIFEEYGSRNALTVHTASQPSHDYSASHPLMDFDINALATVQLLEEHRRFCPESPFVYMSTNKVYGDRVNQLPFIEMETRFELPHDHRYAYGVDESMSLDQSLHSPFGVSKTAGDLMVQEYGRYFGIPTACFRCGCVTGALHMGVAAHGFLSYLVRQVCEGLAYTIIGYKGKQVRDNINAVDLAQAIWMFFKEPRVAEVYNMGGGRTSNCSVQEALDYCGQVLGSGVSRTYCSETRVGDHKWWISDTSKFRGHYPDWDITIDWKKSIEEMVDRWRCS